jgi:hypothetical protein
VNGGRERGEPLPEPFTFEGDVFRLPPPGDSYRQGHAVAAVFSAADLDASAGLAMAFHHAESTFDYDREALIAQLRRRYFADEAARTSSAAPRID